MSDSLKDQLLKAGFKESPRAPGKRTTKKTTGKSSTEKKTKNQSATNPSPQTKNRHRGSAARDKNRGHTSADDPAVVAEKKRIKAAIKELIEKNAIKESSGEITYSYMLGARVKQIFVNKETLDKLAADELVITRLNGNTHIIKPELVEQILALNPDWAIIRNDAKSASEASNAEGYEDYQIPDDLMW